MCERISAPSALWERCSPSVSSSFLRRSRLDPPHTPSHFAPADSCLRLCGVLSSFTKVFHGRNSPHSYFLRSAHSFLLSDERGLPFDFRQLQLVELRAHFFVKFERFRRDIASERRRDIELRLRRAGAGGVAEGNGPQVARGGGIAL